MTRIELGGVLENIGKVHHRLISHVNEASVALAKTIPDLSSL
jgi:predicted phage tail protein